MKTSARRLPHRIAAAYAAIRNECAIVTACDAKHAPYLVNAIASFDAHFPDRPRIIVYDIGLSVLDRLELGRTQAVELRTVPPFVPHWRLNWSWKLFALTNDLPRFVLYLDLPNFVALRSLAPWFTSIQRRGYFLVANGQHMRDVVPRDYWPLHGLPFETGMDWPTFGAGVIGFDRQSSAASAVQGAFEGIEAGLNLGRSATEKNGNYKPDTIRDCPCFRADQTVLNLNFRRVFGDSLQVRRPAMYTGRAGGVEHPAQYLWYARRNARSLSYLGVLAAGYQPLRIVNRLSWRIRIALKEAVKSGLDRMKSAIGKR